MFRIKETESGFIVEIEIIEWSCFGLKKQWKPYITSSGTKNVWYHKSYEMTEMNLIYAIKVQTIKNSTF